MSTTIKIFEAGMYLLSAFGIGIALGGISLITAAFLKKQNRVLENRFAEKDNEFLMRKQRIERVLKNN